MDNKWFSLCALLQIKVAIYSVVNTFLCSYA